MKAKNRASGRPQLLALRLAPDEELLNLSKKATEENYRSEQATNNEL